MSKVFVMLSGGVDSSVAATCLKDQGHEVIGVFMKCWSIEQLDSLNVSKDLYGCFWEEDSNDARLVANKLDIPFYVWNFEEEYKNYVVNYMLEEYRAGSTPNPDVMCNSIIKFGAFYERAKKLGADFVATGHYAKIAQSASGLAICRGEDTSKDQSYFLWKIKKQQIENIFFPIGEFATKKAVREKASQYDLITANKPDSQGLCFIGQLPLRQLLIQVLGEKVGNTIDSQGKILGQHKGAYLYTIGQRNGLGLSGGPWFVNRIDVSENLVIVSNQNEESDLDKIELKAKSLNWQLDLDKIVDNKGKIICQAQIRYRQSPENCQLAIEGDGCKVVFERPVRAVAKGQSIVFYQGDLMLGGGIIC